MSPVGIVTDSTCDLSPEELATMHVSMVPLKVLFGDESFLDWVELRPEAFYGRLTAAAVLPKTSQPSPADFAAAYQELANKGVDGIVSIHLSAALSGTVSSATIAAAEASVPVHVVDTREVTQATGLVVKAAVEAREAGMSFEQVAARAQSVADSTHMYFVLETLDYLVKGGRAGKATGIAAALLNIKPVLYVNDDGIIEPFKKVKGRKKALAELAAHVAEESKTRGRLRVALLHACVPEYAEELRGELEAAGADFELDSIGLVGSVIGTYAGPGAVGCAYYPIG